VAARAPTLAKLTRPKLYDALPRPRLFAALDAAATRPIVWLCAPPGAGKSTLVASWLEARGGRHIWYQADSVDANPATFVHYMRLAAQHVAGKGAAALPVFSTTPEQDLGRFARGFFRDLFSVLPHPCTVVFDNFQEMRVAHAGRVAFAQGLEEIPEGVTVVILSRTDPPPEFARLGAAGRIARIDEAALRCTNEEAEAILGGHGVDRDVLARIQARSEGWVAALALLREYQRRRGAAPDDALGGGKEAIFQYFAGEIFNGAPPGNQRILMLTALLPSITAQDAVALCGDADAPRLLEYLYRRRLFTDRRHGSETTYHYHALFREFLREACVRRLPEQERRRAIAQAATLLTGRGQVSEALALFREVEDWEAMRALIGTHALEWARQGRARALSDWIEALPAQLRAEDPWLEYWYGRAWIFAEPARGRPPLERAFAKFVAASDLRGQALTLSTIATGYYYEWANFAPLDRWLPEFERLLGGGGADALDRESDLRVHAAWLITLLLRRSDDPNLARCAARLGGLIDGEPDPNLRLLAASTLLNYINWNTSGDTADALVARIEPVLAQPGVSPLMQLWWRTHLSFREYVKGRYAESSAVMREARAIAERYGLEAYLFEIDHADASALINAGEHAAARTMIDIMERRLSPARRMQWPYFHHMRSMLEQREGRLRPAADDAEKAVALARELGAPSLQMPHFLARVAQARSALGDRDGALAACDEAIALASPAERHAFEQRRCVLVIEADLAAGDVERAAAGLSALLADYRATGQVLFLRNRPDLAARLANLALARGIEPDYVRSLVRSNALAPPPDAGAEWPFRIRVRVLGGFELARDGAPVRFTGKAQQRPLDLLKLLVAHGGTDVDTQHAMAALWPDSDGAAAKNSFDSTLFRLRKLLDVEDALTLASGKLSLSRTLAWTDLWTLDAVFVAVDRADDAGVESAPATLARRLLAAWGGPLLGAEDAAWIVQPRDALRARVVRTLLALGERLEQRGDFDVAIDVYRRGLEADNLAEPLYRGLMRALAATGDRAEAVNAFRRCRELLSIVLGIPPSAETERLYRALLGAGVADPSR